MRRYQSSKRARETSSPPSSTHWKHSNDDLHTWGASPSMHELLIDRASSYKVSQGIEYYHRNALRRALRGQLDRVNELGDDAGYGHSGCVNALSWALDGEVLISGGDDTTVRLWRLDRYDTSTPYPYKCDAVIHTGHTDNIFNAHLLPFSSKIATVAGDRQVRVFDVERAISTTSRGRQVDFSTNETLLFELHCHRRRTKRIATEESPSSFLSVAEDGTVRQHDLRMPHQCGRRSCPQPLVKLPFDLSALALSPLAPYQFVVAGESQYGYLFDRRQIKRNIEVEWGVPCTTEDYVTCLRRFGRESRGQGEIVGSEHVTGARMAQTNSYEVLLSYSGDAVYLYSTRDDPCTSSRSSSILPRNTKKKSGGRSISERPSSPAVSDQAERITTVSSVRSDSSDRDVDEGSSLSEAQTEEEGDTTTFLEDNVDEKFITPIIMPQRRFSGHRNTDTVKDVNFVGPEDEFVASGSDGGHFFLWDKESGRLHDIYEGDGTVVNVVECHPHLPLIACSGIDTTVKLFAPTRGKSKFSRMHQAAELIEENARQSIQYSREHSAFSGLLLRYRAAMLEAAESEDFDGNRECRFQ